MEKTKHNPDDPKYKLLVLADVAIEGGPLPPPPSAAPAPKRPVSASAPAPAPAGDPAPVRTHAPALGPAPASLVVSVAVPPASLSAASQAAPTSNITNNGTGACPHCGDRPAKMGEHIKFVHLGTTCQWPVGNNVCGAELAEADMWFHLRDEHPIISQMGPKRFKSNWPGRVEPEVKSRRSAERRVRFAQSEAAGRI
ncbi:hypothetical protein F5Y16DRAFT_401270 [Xylariaceae sp. FL0255]|nr:hypothetical protein F5Y16DRAFT_401270 [Xylariaceae sp. FL0255]